MKKKNGYALFSCISVRIDVRLLRIISICSSYYGKREIWEDREEAKDYFIRQIMTAEGKERNRAECVYIQLIHDLDECSDK